MNLPQAAAMAQSQTMQYSAQGDNTGFGVYIVNTQPTAATSEPAQQPPTRKTLHFRETMCILVLRLQYCIRPCSLSYQYAHCLSEVKCVSSRRLLSRFRSGCHGLRVDTGRWENNIHLDRKDRLCLVFSSAQQVEDEHHFLFDCPAYSSIRASHASLFQCACSVSDFFDSKSLEQMHVVDSLGTVLA